MVTIRLDEHAEGTELNLSHAFAEAPVRDEHVQGWRYQLSLFGNVTANEAQRRRQRGGGRVVRRMVGTGHAGARVGSQSHRSEDVQFHDQFSLIHGLDDLRPHLAAVHKFMPGMRIDA